MAKKFTIIYGRCRSVYVSWIYKFIGRFVSVCARFVICTSEWGIRAIHTDQFSGTSSRCQSTCTSKLACVSCRWYQNFTGASHWYAYRACSIRLPATDTRNWHRLYWYQKTGQCVWPFSHDLAHFRVGLNVFRRFFDFFQYRPTLTQRGVGPN